jgi:hypothetical protein
MGQFARNLGMNDFPLTQTQKCPLGLLSVGVIQFRRVDTRKPDVLIADDKGIAVDHPAPSADDLPLRAVRWRGRARNWFEQGFNPELDLRQSGRAVLARV